MMRSLILGVLLASNVALADSQEVIATLLKSDAEAVLCVNNKLNSEFGVQATTSIKMRC